MFEENFWEESIWSCGGIQSEKMLRKLSTEADQVNRKVYFEYMVNKYNWGKLNLQEDL